MKLHQLLLLTNISRKRQSENPKEKCSNVVLFNVNEVATGSRTPFHFSDDEYTSFNILTCSTNSNHLNSPLSTHLYFRVTWKDM